MRLGTPFYTRLDVRWRQSASGHERARKKERRRRGAVGGKQRENEKERMYKKESKQKK